MICFKEQVARADVQKGTGKFGQQESEPDFRNTKKWHGGRAEQQRDRAHQKPYEG